MNSINEIQNKKISIRLIGDYETKLRNCRKIHEKILNFETNNIASNDVSS